MKIVVIGGTGLVGTKVVMRLAANGHEAVAAAPKTGVDTINGRGLAEVLTSAQVIVDVTNSPSFENQAVMDFFATSTNNLLKYGAAAGVRHFVVLSVVGSDRLSESPYIRGKLVQERLIKESGLPYSIVHATQFFEFIKTIADLSTKGDQVHVAPVLIQPMACDDVAEAVATISRSKPLNGVVEFGGPEQFRLEELIHLALSAIGDPRKVVADPNALYYGAHLSERTLIPGDDARLGSMRFKDWIALGNLQKEVTGQFSAT
jgi:uncharacterized protein YbjT (DUF2867 family)